MPLFITYASYSNSGAKGLVDKPSDRTGVIKGVGRKSRRQVYSNVFYDRLKRHRAHYRGR